MPIASDIFRVLTYKVEATYGTAPAAASAQALRRVSSTLDLNKDTYQSNEIRTDYQVSDYRHGVRRVNGKISGELSAGTYKDFFAAMLKRAFATVASITGASITVAGTGPTWTITRAAGSYLSDGVKVGQVIRLTAGSFNALNLNKNLLVITLTATIATVVVVNGSALFAEGPIGSATVAITGKVTFVPQTGHTDLSYSIEHFYTDLTQSELFTGCKFDAVTVQLPPTGMATVEFDVQGQNITAASAQYFTSPTAATTTGVMAAVNGVLRMGGVAVATLTGLTLEIDPDFKTQPVVGSNTIPGLTPGTVTIKGQATAFFDSVTLRDAFLNESEIDLIAVFTADNSAAADFITFVLPRIKLGGSAKAPGDGGLLQTIPIMALLNKNGGAGISTELTTMTMQDSQA